MTEAQKKIVFEMKLAATLTEEEFTKRYGEGNSPHDDIDENFDPAWLDEGTE
jgi:hypothetical protein